MSKKVVLVSAALLSFGSHGSTYNGTVQAVVCHTATPVCQVRLNDPHTGESCATQVWWKFTFDGSTPEGKNVLSILLAAQAAQKTVQIGGRGTCSLDSGSEDLRHIFISTPK